MGNRTTIIRKTKELMLRMDMSPYEFCLNYDVGGLKRLKGFKHRTFNEGDLFTLLNSFIITIELQIHLKLPL